MILKEVEHKMTFHQQRELIDLFTNLYMQGEENPDTLAEHEAVMKSLLSWHVPVVLEHVFDFTGEVLKIVPEIKEKLDLIPERTNHFIGWMNYAYTGELYPDTLAQLLNDALGDYSGPVIANSVYSSKYGENGIVFTSKKIEDTEAQAYFEDMLNQVNADTGADDDDEFDTDGEDSEPF
jgi:hypothetical protein